MNQRDQKGRERKKYRDVQSKEKRKGNTRERKSD